MSPPEVYRPAVVSTVLSRFFLFFRGSEEHLQSFLGLLWFQVSSAPVVAVGVFGVLTVVSRVYVSAFLVVMEFF